MNDLSTTGFALLRVLDEIMSHHCFCGKATSKRSKRPSKLRPYTRSCIAYWRTLRCGAGQADDARIGKAVAFARAYLEIVYDHFPNFHRLDWDVQLSIVQTAIEWDGPFEKAAKWAVSAPMAAHLMNDLPPKPFENISIIPFTGAAKRFLHNVLIARKSKQNLHFWNSILLGVKRGCLPPDESMVEKQLSAHAAGLSKLPAPFEPDMQPFLRQCFRNLKPIRRVCHIRDTGGAAYDTARSMGGKWEAIVRKHNGVTFDEPLCNSELLYMTPTRSFYGRLVPTWLEIRAMIAADDADNVRAIGLLEPLKVRVITTGDPMAAVYFEPMRKRVHDLLRVMPVFKPLHEPKINNRDLANIVQRETKLGLNFPSWVSGDYAAATDNLNMNATKQCISAIAASLGRQCDIGLIERSLCGTQLNYPGTNIETQPQRNGQLMGNPMSFPILCLVNLFAYKQAIDEYLATDVPIESLPVLVNGDDIVFRADHRLLSIWTKHIHAVGFSLSVGKYYVHPTVLTMNSQMFVHKPRSTSGPGATPSAAINDSDFVEIKYTNPGLLYKFGFAGNKQKTSLLPIDQIFNQYLDGCWSKQRGQKQLRYYWKPLIQQQTDNGRFNLYLPRSSGGLGVNPYGIEFKTTQFQRWLAFVMHQFQNWDPHRAQKLTNAACFVGSSDRCCIRRTNGLRMIWLSAEPSQHEIDAFEAKISRYGLGWRTNDVHTQLVEYDSMINTAFAENCYGLIPQLHRHIMQLKQARTFDDINRAHNHVEWCAKSGEIRMDRDFDPDYAWHRRLYPRDISWLRAWAGFGPSDLLPDIPAPADRNQYWFGGRLICTST